MHDTKQSASERRRSKVPAEVRAKIIATLKKRWAAKRDAKAAPKVPSIGSVFSRVSKQAGVAGKNGALSAVGPAFQAEGAVLEFDPAHCRPSKTNRTFFDPDKARELDESVKEHGQLQPGIVRPLEKPEGRVTHEIVVGERRWHSAKRTGRKFRAQIRDLSDIEALELQAVENLQREDLNAIDEATKYQQLRDAYEADGATKTAALARICEKMKKKPSTVAKLLALLKLPDEIQTLAHRGALPRSHASELGKIKDPATAISLAKQIMHPTEGKDAEGVMPIRQTEKLVDIAVQREENLAAWQKEATEFRAKGFAILTAEESKKYLHGSDDTHAWWTTHGGPYVKADGYCSLNGAGNRQYNKLWKKAPLPILGRLEDGRPVHVYDAKQADAMVTAGGKLYKSGLSSTSGVSESEREKTRAHNARKSHFKGAVGLIVKEIECVAEGSVFWKFFANCLVNQWRSEPITRTMKRRGIGSKPALHAEMEKMGVGELRALCAEILLYAHAPSMWSERWSAGFLEACALFKTPLLNWNGKGFVDFQAPGNEEDDEP